MAKRDLFTGGNIPLEPGARDRSVTVQQLTEGTGSSGFPTSSWTTLATVWMQKQDMRARERYEFGQLSASADTRWEMGYRTDMDPELVDVAKVRRLVYQGRIYDIVEASVIGRRDGIELVTLAKVG